MASTYLQRTQAAATGTAAQKFTFSAWVRKCKNGANQGLYGNTYSSTHRGFLYFDSSDRFTLYDSNGAEVATSALLRDVNAFYHVVCSVDTTQSTASDRVKLYINGVLQTALNATTYPSQNQDLKIMNTTNTPRVGAYDNGSGTVNYFDGVMSHVHFTQGYSYDASVFGSTDATTGEWKITTSPTVANYGTNGFWILKDGNSVTDQSPNSNNWTVTGGTLTKTEDCPSNVFPIFTLLDPVTHSYNGGTSNAKTTIQSTSNEYPYLVTSMGANKGKFYWEMKISATSSGSGDTEAMVGIVSTRANSTTQELGHKSTDYGYYAYDGKYRNNDTSTTYGNTFTTNDIIGVAMDLDNNKLYFSKNGTWQNSGVPTSGSTGTGAIAIADPDTTEVGFYVPAVCVWSSGVNSTFQANFGNGYFGTTAVASAGTNASNNGIFEYDVPTGYTALSTKGLNI